MINTNITIVKIITKIPVLSTLKKTGNLVMYLILSCLPLSAMRTNQKGGTFDLQV